MPTMCKDNSGFLLKEMRCLVLCNAVCFVGAACILGGGTLREASQALSMAQRESGVPRACVRACVRRRQDYSEGGTSQPWLSQVKRERSQHVPNRKLDGGDELSRSDEWPS